MGHEITNGPATDFADCSDWVVAEVRQAIARYLLASAVAEAVNRGECPACRALDAELAADCSAEVRGIEGLAEALRAGDCPECGRAIPSAGPGEDWVEVVGEAVDDRLDGPAAAGLWALVDRVLAAIGGEAEVRAAVEHWVGACRGELDDTAGEDFGSLLAAEALAFGVGLSDRVPFDGRSVVESDGAWAVVVSRHDGPTGVESTHSTREAAVEALRAGRYSSPAGVSGLIDLEITVDYVDFGALLACSPECVGVVAGEYGVERCDDCGRGLADDERAAVRLGRLLAERSRIGDAFDLVRGGRAVSADDFAALLDLLGRAAEARVGGAEAMLARLGGPAPGEFVDLADGTLARVVRPDGPGRIVVEHWARNGDRQAVSVAVESVERRASRPVGRLLDFAEAEALRAGGAILDGSEVEAVIGALDGVDAEDDPVGAALLARLLDGGESPEVGSTCRAESVAVREVRSRLLAWARDESTPDPDELAECVRLLDGTEQC